MPKTFIVFTRESTEDQVELDRYAGAVGASFDGGLLPSLPPMDRTGCWRARLSRAW